VVSMGDKWDRHPFMDGLIRFVELPRLSGGPGGEDDSARDRQQKGEPNSHAYGATFLPRFNIAGSRSETIAAAPPEHGLGMRFQNPGRTTTHL